MSYHFSPMTAAEAHETLQWRWEPPYDIYNAPDFADIDELLDPRSPYFAVRDDAGALVGFFCYGTAAEVGNDSEPTLLGSNGTLSIGLALRPDHTGRGLGADFVCAGMDYARQHFAPSQFQLFVLTFNQRAIRLYERLGFTHMDTVRVPSMIDPSHTWDFWHMTCPA